MSSLILQTGQYTCHDGAGHLIDCAGSGQDAEYACGQPWPLPRFEIQGESVLDRLTSLVWSRNAAPAEFPLSWDEAFTFVAGMNRDRCCGYSDWRLPNRRELRSLIDHQNRRPALAPDYPFEHLFCGWYWSSTTAAISPAHAWYVDLDGGRIFYGGKDQSYMVWPVRGRSPVLAVTGQRRCFDTGGKPRACGDSGQDGELQTGAGWPHPRFVEKGPEVLDRLTGLYWRRNLQDSGGALVWEEALAHVTRLSRELGRPLRLPNINELESLVDCAQHSPALPNGHPFIGLGDVYWSATTSLFEPDWAWALYLDKGAVGVGLKRHARFHLWTVADTPTADH